MNKPILEIDEVLNEAIMTGVPTVIVEGIDDVPIYSGLFKKLPFNVEIYAIENIKDFSEGCEQVISAIEILNNLNIDIKTICKNILGIIDKDVRDFRNEIPNYSAILTLKFYSVESHFYSKNVIKALLDNFSIIDKSRITEELTSVIMHKIESKVLDLYYFSLEALKNSLEHGYVSLFRYSDRTGRMQDPQLRASIEAKKNDLDIFASQLGLSLTIDNLLLIAKGKWLLEKFCDEIMNTLRLLPDMCSANEIDICRSCLAQAYDKCMYRLRDGVTKRTIESFALNVVENDNFDYVLDRVSMLAPANLELRSSCVLN